jgi:Rap1a immunity proteins
VIRIAITEAAVMAAMLSLSGPSVADDVFRLSSVSTAELMQACRGGPMRFDCAGYILGVFDEMALSHLICPPENPAGLSTQAVAVALKSINDHPEKWDRAPAWLIGQSFQTAFPCNGG